VTILARTLLVNDEDIDDGEKETLQICWVVPFDFDIADKDTGRVLPSDLVTTSKYGAAVNLTIRSDSSLSEIIYDPSDSEFLQALAVGEKIRDRFAYTVVDIHGAPGLAEVEVIVTGTNAAPVAADDTGFATDEETILEIPFAAVLANDTDIDSTVHTSSDIQMPPGELHDILGVLSADSTSDKGATVIVDSNNGLIRYDPSESQTLNLLSKKEVVFDTFTYTMVDGNGGSDTAKVTVRITGANDTPIASDDSYVSATENQRLSVDPGDGVLSNDADPDMNDSGREDRLVALPVFDGKSALGVTVILNQDGSFSYLADEVDIFEGLAVGETMTDTFEYSTTDGSLVLANDDAFRVVGGAAGIQLPVLANDVDLSERPLGSLFILAVGNPSQGGVASINGALDGYSANQPVQVGQVLESVTAYSSVLRNHIHKEDHIFFPMVQETLSAEEEEELKVEFDKAREKSGENVFEDSHKLVVDMGSMLIHM
jgi:VCBS repeat-containing protein